MTAFLGFLYSIITALFFGFLNKEKEFRCFFAIPLGFGFCSILYFLFLLTGISNITIYKIFEFLLVIIAAFVIFTNKNFHNFCIELPKKISLPLASANLLALMIFLKFYINSPLGNWDGFRMWNTKAEFMFRDITLWKNMFLQPHFLSHNDYPLFTPASVARIWQYAGSDNSVFNAFFYLILTFGIIYFVYFTIKHFKNKKLAMLTTLILMLTPAFLVKGAAQCADIPLAYFILASTVSLFLYFEKEKNSFLVLSTIFAGFCGWVKNEGLMFFAIFLAVTGTYFFLKKYYKKIGIMLVSAMPFVILICIFKSVCKTPNDLVQGFFVLKSYTHLFQAHYYIMIIKTFAHMFVERFSVVFVSLALMLKGFSIPEKIKTPLILSGIIFILTCSGYFMTYVLSPHDLDWLLTYSLDRIILHVLPLFLFLYALCLKIGQEDTEN